MSVPGLACCIAADDVQVMDNIACDVIVIGAGIAGATATAPIAPHRRVVLIEAEEAAGYHTTGRSAAMWIGTYGSPDAVAMSRLSRPFLDAPPPGFAAVPLLHHRPVLTMATAAQEPAMRAAMPDMPGIRELPVAALYAMIPALRPGYATAAIIEDECYDIDVAALLQGFLRPIRATGGAIMLRSRAGGVTRTSGRWQVAVTGGRSVSAPVLVDAAVEGFFWSVGQGGYGIQTSPAQGQLVADLLLGRDPGPATDIMRLVDPARFTV